jgi:anaerobic selenocysteine-containing dehydrogenase
VSTANPLRSHADTSAYEAAFEKLDLAVTVDPSMTETAALSDYVLPARSGYESWDGGPKPGYPKIFLQFRPGVVEPEGEQLEAGEIYLHLADRLGLIPEIPESLHQAAETGDRTVFGAALMSLVQSNPQVGGVMPQVLGQTLGKQLGSVHLATIWGMLQFMPPTFHDMAQRVGFTPGPGLGEEIFQAVLKHPEGLWIGAVDADNWDHLQAVVTEDGRINLDVPEMTEWIKEINPDAEAVKLEEDKEKYPLLMSSGLHWDLNANTGMRDPEWNKGKRAFTALIHPDEADASGIDDGQMVRITTEAGSITIEMQTSDLAAPGHILVPHGFGLVHQGKTYGANTNRLAKNTNRDKIAATPLHRYIRCRIDLE